ncbi:hypothetical protein B0H13DRAFT_2353092 [Mycena leptocephala]|nr:hypothetical protein B0H13DRAFT_2353092 [Mycena leptocephala]
MASLERAGDSENFPLHVDENGASPANPTKKKTNTKIQPSRARPDHFRGPPSTIDQNTRVRRAPNPTATSIGAARTAVMTTPRLSRRERLEAASAEEAAAFAASAPPPVPAVQSSARTRLRRRPVNGVRQTRIPPLSHEKLWLTRDRPRLQTSTDPRDMCSICESIKSHPVLYECGHSHCYVCCRLFLEVAWKCPEFGCEAIMYCRPVRDSTEEARITAAHPNRKDNSRVDYSWDGLIFPKRPASP